MKNKTLKTKVLPISLAVLESVGVVATGYFAARAGKRIVREIDESDMTVKEKIKAEAQYYIPAVATGAATIGAIAGSTALGIKTNTALIGAVATAESMYETYRSKVISREGEQYDVDLRSDIIKDKIRKERKPVIFSESTAVDLPTDEVLTFYDEYRDDYFETTAAEMYAAELQLNRLLTVRGYVSLNDFYRYLGIPTIAIGDDIGWSLEVGPEYYGYEYIDFTHQCVELDTPLSGTSQPLIVWMLIFPFQPTKDFMGEYPED